jgi:microcompartment protein CcmL/EutN
VSNLDSIGLLELSSIGMGILAQDVMLKAANVELIIGRTICSGKYLVLVGGDIAAVQSSVTAGGSAGAGYVIEERVIPRVHEAVFPAIAQSVDLNPEDMKALGVIETFSASSVIEVGDEVAKAANVILFRMHLAMAAGGKGFVMFTGDIASVEAGLAAGAEVASRDGMLICKVAIPAPRKDAFREFI